MKNMIKKLEIKNFEAHKHTVLEFGPGLNVIHGRSNNGKSATLRALELAAYGVWAAGENKKSGIHGPVRIGEKFVEVFVESSRGSVYSKRGSKGINEWKIKDSKGGDLELTNPGSGSIPQAQEVLGLKSVDVAGQSIRFNWSDQRDKHFLIDEVEGKSSSPSFVAAILDEVGGLSGCEDLVRSLASDKSSSEQQMRQSAEEVESFNEDLKEYENIDKELESINKAESLLDESEKNKTKSKQALEKLKLLIEIDEKLKKFCNLKKEIKEREFAEKTIDECACVFDNLEKNIKLNQSFTSVSVKLNKFTKDLDKYESFDINEINKKTETIEKGLINYSSSNSLISSLNNINSDLEKAEKTSTGLDFRKTSRLSGRLDQSVSSLDSISSSKTKLDRIINSIEKIDISQSVEILKEKQKELDSLLNEYELCPFCNQQMSSDCKQEILSEI